MTMFAFPILLASLLVPGVHAQLVHPIAGPTPSFEVATVKPSPNDSPSTNFGIAPGRFSARSATVEELIKLAYNVKASNGIEGEPKWATSEKFDIQAKIDDTEAEAMQKLQPAQRLDQYRLMMQSLLTDRFGLTTSTRTKMLPVYALVVAKNGPKLEVVEHGKAHMPSLWGGSRGELHASSVSMGMFADWLSGNVDVGGRPIIDQTGLKDSYDFTLKWTRNESGANAMAGLGTSHPVTSVVPTEQGGPSLYTALQEQLGLKLESRKGPVEVLVIDQLKRPTPN
ncbi:TIGR03435 family protein [Acidicapsa dinghuensis]|uniref:TIGR03435 family protein n=2 Tax=Acidicapsa dinghuensis TaxID=2218256 RepID=A0ABW1EDV5_9BACT